MRRLGPRCAGKTELAARGAAIFAPAALLLVCLATSLYAAEPQCSRVVAVGDLHGGYDAFVTILRKTGLVGQELNWTGEKACLVQTGDVVDRGADSRKILDLLMSLEQQAPGRVHALLGNHETMNLQSDLRYVLPGEFEAFADEETAEQRQDGLTAFRAANAGLQLEKSELLTRFDQQFPPGWFAHRKAFSPEGRYGAWLLSRPTAVKIGRTVYVHGGLAPRDAALGVDFLNRLMTRQLRDFLSVWDGLVRKGLLSPLTSVGEAFRIADARLAEAAAAEHVASEQTDPGQHADKPEPPAGLEEFRALVAFRGSLFLRPDGPLWNRDLARADEREYREVLENTLNLLDVDRIVVAHTPTKNGRIETRFEDRVVLIDTGAGPAYGGSVSALEAVGEEFVAVHLDGSTQIGEAAWTDARIERFLSESEVVEVEELGTGITRPRKVTLASDGRRRIAAFKTVDEKLPGVTRFEGGKAPPEVNFTDSFKYERAAYLLDRRLKLYMVPVTVLRKVNEETGALVDWVHDAITEAARQRRGLLPPDPLVLERQQDLMHVFDALLLNTDPNPGNQLITTSDWRLYLIDHTRSFRPHAKLPKSFLSRPVTITRSLLKQLESLSIEDLSELLDEVLGKRQMRALLKRRDKILEKISADREEYGDARIIQDEPGDKLGYLIGPLTPRTSTRAAA